MPYWSQLPRVPSVGFWLVVGGQPFGEAKEPVAAAAGESRACMYVRVRVRVRAVPLAGSLNGVCGHWRSWTG